MGKARRRVRRDLTLLLFAFLTRRKGDNKEINEGTFSSAY